MDSSTGGTGVTKINGFELIRGNYQGLEFPITFVQDSGMDLADFLETGWPGLFLISSKVKNLFEENNFIGWKTFPIQIIDKNKVEVHGYWGLSITGKCGRIDYSKCEIIERQLAPLAPMTKYFKGLYVGLDRWDRQDLFLPENYYGIIVTDHVAEILRMAELKNFELKNLIDIETPEFAIFK